jgi:hypothetical protein
MATNDNSNFGLVEPFEIDNDSLKNLSPQYVFTMGVEWAMFREKLNSETPFTIFCLPENAGRFVRMAERKNRFVEDRQTGCDGWTEIWVGDYVV